MIIKCDHTCDHVYILLLARTVLAKTACNCRNAVLSDTLESQLGIHVFFIVEPQCSSCLDSWTPGVRLHGDYGYDLM